MNSKNKALALWLLVCAAMVFAMALIGAITRLTESGLSMVEWRPLIGTLPPLDELEWQRVFDLYRETPEYQNKNFGMELVEFKNIFFWEWFHRLWGRMIGMVYALPFFGFLIAKKIDRQKFWPLFGLLILGGCQGLMGWYMVQSGLVDRPSVSHYRLAAHLGLAFIIFGLLWRQALQFINPDASMILEPTDKKYYTYTWVPLFLFSITFLWGAFVAGLDAGMIYNEFPLMGGRWIPSDMWHLPIWWQNFLDNHAGVQFTHRVLAMITGMAVIVSWYKTSALWFSTTIRRLSWAMLGVVLIQISLGILTLLSQVNIVLATLHQGGALVLLAILIWHQFELKKALQF